MCRIKLKALMFFLFLILVTCTPKTDTNTVNENEIKQATNTLSDASSINDTSTALTEKTDPVVEKQLDSAKSIEQSTWTMKADSEWYALYTRLKKDGIYGEDIDSYFMHLEGKFSQKPMGIKIRELYNTSFRKKVKKEIPEDKSPNTTGIPRPWYKDYVTTANAQKCRNFINANLEAFTYLEKKYGIPAEVVSALIYIETKHGDYLGEHNPFVNLASMASSTKIEQIPTYIKKLPLAKEKKAWILKKMKEKSNWSYNELESLLIYCRENKIDPLTLPSSVYGALGFGQFMPTNIPHYAVDGNDDGIINLFHPADGIVSAANFLYKHGWNKSSLTLSQKTRVLKRYNYSNQYANTILALSVLTDKIK